MTEPARLADAVPKEGLDRVRWWASGPLLAVALLLLAPPVRSTWHSVYGGRWLYILSLSTLLAFALTPLVRQGAAALGVLDLPAARKVHTTPTPLLGGLGVYVAFVVALLANSILDAQVWAILAGGTLLLLVGILDDVRGAPASLKLAAQFAATGIAMGSGVTLTLFPTRWSWGLLLNGILTILWVLGITNAMNFFDGMDGLATGLAIITAGFMGIVAYQTTQPFLGWLASAIVGSCLGFLPYNFRPRRPASIFLGDAGSTFLGFVLATIAVKGEWAENNIIDTAAPVLIFWVFVFDMTHITLARVLTGRVRTLREWIEFVGRDHLHHRLAALLGSQKDSVLLIFILSACMGLAAVALRNARPVDALLLILQAVLIVTVVTVLERRGNRP